MTFEEIAANMNGVAFKEGSCFFDVFLIDQEDIYKERIVNWRDILKDEDMKIGLGEIHRCKKDTGGQKTKQIDNTLFDRVYILFGLQSVFHLLDIPTFNQR